MNRIKTKLFIEKLTLSVKSIIIYFQVPLDAYFNCNQEKKNEGKPDEAYKSTFRKTWLGFELSQLKRCFYEENLVSLQQKILFLQYYFHSNNHQAIKLTQTYTSLVICVILEENFDA